MGNFASSADWLHSDNVAGQRCTITPISHNSLPINSIKPATQESSGDLVALLVSRAITTCKQSIHSVFSRAIGPFHHHSSNSATTTDDEWMDDVFGEFQIVYEDNYVPVKSRNADPRPTQIQPQTQHDESPVFQDTPWFQYSPADFQTISTASVATWKKHANQDDDDNLSVTTEGSSEWHSDSDCASDTNPASSTDSSYCASEQNELANDDEDEFYQENDDIETKAACLLRLASSCDEDTFLFVDDYLCPCGRCPQYKQISHDVTHVVTWREPEELLSIVRILQAFATYNETIAYHPDMIAAADECLRIWSGDENQAFSSFVVLQDEVPYLCAGLMV